MDLKSIASLPLKDIPAIWDKLSKEKKQLKNLEEAIKNRIKSELNGKEVILFDGDYGAKWENRNTYEIPVMKAEKIINDSDHLNMILKFDIKKAKEILDEKTYQQLDKAKEVIGTTQVLKIGKIKN